MIKWFKRNSKEESSEAELVEAAETEVLNQEQSGSEAKENKAGFFHRLRQGLAKTRHQLGENIGRILLGQKEIDASLLDELEMALVSADLGMDTSQALLKELSDSLARHQLTDGEAVMQALEQLLQDKLSVNASPLNFETEEGTPFVILMVGVNGAGKTTTIGKLAKLLQAQGKKVMLAAGDTFRAAAVEQLQIWGERNHIPVIAQHTGADSASVVYDALQAAKARGVDVLIADTAGRLHTQGNLMEELKKVKRVLQKLEPKAPHETMLVLDASIGQNALFQAQQFNNSIGLTGITMTKLDGTAKGGILFAIANDLGIPFRYIGIGEGIDDLRPFDAAQFVNAIFHDDHL